MDKSFLCVPLRTPLRPSRLDKKAYAQLRNSRCTFEDSMAGSTSGRDDKLKLTEHLGPINFRMHRVPLCRALERQGYA